MLTFLTNQPLQIVHRRDVVQVLGIEMVKRIVEVRQTVIAVLCSPDLQTLPQFSVVLKKGKNVVQLFFDQSLSDEHVSRDGWIDMPIINVTFLHFKPKQGGSFSGQDSAGAAVP